jgi:excisionase family DNA binding protein
MARSSELRLVLERLGEVIERIDMLEEKLSLAADDVLDVDGAAQYLGVAKSYVYRLTAAVAERGGCPELPHFKRGRKLAFRKSDLAAWRTERRVLGRSEIQAMVH